MILNSTLTRRRFIVRTAATAGLAALAPRLSLAAPSLAPSAGEDGALVLKAAPGPTKLTGEGKPAADLWLYNGVSPGPTIRVRQGENVHVRLENGLEQPTSMHWHGVRIDNAMDGVPGLTQPAVEPDASFDYRFVAPDAGTYWYHTHERTWEQLARGLYGVLIVEEPDATGFDRDVPLLFDDWRLGEDGKLDETSFGQIGEWAHQGRYGNWLTLNSQTEPEIGVAPGERVRLRLCNTANARVLKVRLDGFSPWLMALDGHPVTPRRLGGEIELAPAQRADVAIDIDMAAGETRSIFETSTGEDLLAGSLVAEGTPGKAPRGGPPAMLPLSMPHGDFRPQDGRTVALSMTGGAMGGMGSARHNGKLMDMRELVENGRVWAMNGVAGDLDAPLLTAARGETINIPITNDTAWPHAMHLHGHHFMVTEVNGEPVVNGDWRDTYLMAPREIATLSFVADNPGKWLLHCHMREHHAGGMGTFVAVA